MFQKMIGEGVYSSIVNCKYLPDKKDIEGLEKVLIYSIFAYLVLLCLYPEVSLATDDLKTLSNQVDVTVTKSVAPVVFSVVGVFVAAVCIIRATIIPMIITFGVGILYGLFRLQVAGGFQLSS
jgi:hypothetical protein